MEFISLALLISLLWGIQPVVHKYILDFVDPWVMMVLTSAVYFACIIIFTLFYWKRLKTGFSKLSLKMFLLIALVAIFTAFIANLIYFNILKSHASYITAVLIYSSPLFTTLIAYMFLKEKITASGLIGCFFIVAGIVTIAYDEQYFESFQVRD